MYLRGFDRRGSVATINKASASGFTVSGAWSDQADFAVLMLFDADDLFGHLQTSRYLPDFSLANVTLDFDLALTGCMNPTSTKYQSVPWGALSYVTASEVASTVALPTPTSTTGGAKASAGFTVAGSPSTYDRVQLVYSGNSLVDISTITTPSTVTFAFYNSYGTGYHHFITIASNTYTYIQLAGDSSGAIATALAALITAGADPNATAVASTNNVTLTSVGNLGSNASCSASDGNGSGTLTETGYQTLAQIAAAIAAGVNALTSPSIPISATSAGAVVTVTATVKCRDGNGIELLTMYKAAGNTQFYPTGATGSPPPSGLVAKLTGGLDPTSFHYHLDFSALGLASVRQIWLTLAPWLTYDSGAVNASLVAFVPTEFSATFSNWTVTDPGTVTPLKMAGPGSVTVGSMDAWASYSGPGWAQQVGTFFHGFGQASAHAGDTVTVTYSCQSVHNLYLGTELLNANGQFSVAVDGGAPVTVSCYALTSSAIFTRRLIASGIAAGTHSVVLTVAAGAHGTNCVFDYLQAAVLSDPVAPGTTYPAINAACDFDTDQTYKIAPARLLWILSQMGFQGDIDFYAGVFFALKRKRSGGTFHQATITLSGTINSGNGFGGGADTIWVTLGGTFPNSGTTISGATTRGGNPGGGGIGGTALGAVAYPADTLTTLAQRIVDAINCTFVGVCAARTVTAGQFTVTVLSPINGFTFDASVSVSAGISIAVSGDVGTVSLIGGQEGTWQVDATQASPLNRGFTDYLADLGSALHAASQTMTVAFSQELLAPPDANTAGGAWAQRFADGSTVLTATGFGSWGAGFVESVAAGVYQQTGHGYVTGNTGHFASGIGSGEWALVVTDANHYTLGTQIANSGGYTPAATDSVFIDLQTSQCTFNPATVTAYLALCYVQAANILAAAGLVPWLQFGEVGWWFFSERMSEAVGYASWTSPISIGTVAAHGFVTGQSVIVAGVLGCTAANGTWPIVVVDTTHFTLTGSSGNAAYTSGGTASGGGMAFYDAWAASVHAVGAYYTQDDVPSGGDATWLQSAIATHIATIIAATLAAQAGAKFELLYPCDTNNPTAYWTQNEPYPEGGRMNTAINFPAAYQAMAGSGLNRLKIEALSWGSTYRNLDLIKAAAAFPFTMPNSWAAANVAYLLPIYNGGCPWQREYLTALAQSIPLMTFFALDHMTLYSWWPIPTFATFNAGVDA